MKKYLIYAAIGVGIFIAYKVSRNTVNTLTPKNGSGYNGV